MRFFQEVELNRCAVVTGGKRFMDKIELFFEL
jgi:hypothetical protein